ncbi:MAG TPA: serine/threonine-protein kinase [Ktedonobacteraceae bacterium]|nr:serine/threonine-protein kinase [Ktedonobacteraceae bacterium]
MSAYINRQIGNYIITDAIASGGFGRVYKGHHIYLTERIVAIKLLQAFHIDSTEERQSFLQEAQILEKLKHPHILPILDVGIDDTVPFLITEYAPNGSLHTRIAQQHASPFPTNEALRIVTQIGEAIQFAHQQQIIHRDLKPDNILFNSTDEVLVADFGIAVILETSSIRNTAATGTPSYMAPEQFRGSVSRESDQYSLGCIAYELFTGKRPFEVNDFISLGFMHATEQVVPPHQLNPEIPPHVEQAILKAMGKQRHERFPDIASFIAALNAIPPTVAAKPFFQQPEPLMEEQEVDIAPPPPPINTDAPVSNYNTPYGQGNIAYPPTELASMPYTGYSPQAFPMEGYASQEKNSYNSMPQYQQSAGYAPQAFQQQMLQTNRRANRESFDMILPQDEKDARNYYLIYFLLQLFTSYLAPIISLILFFIFLNKSKTKGRFMRFHFMQATLLQVVADVVLLLTVICLGNASTTDAYGTTTTNGTATFFAVIGVLALLGLFSYWLYVLSGIAKRKYTQLPVIGKYARKFADEPFPAY